jgi:type I restriction enzyme R subunit
LVHDLENQGYEYVPGLNTLEKMLGNVRVQLQALNGVEFLDGEWLRLVFSHFIILAVLIKDNKVI